MQTHEPLLSVSNSLKMPWISTSLSLLPPFPAALSPPPLLGAGRGAGGGFTIPCAAAIVADVQMGAGWS